MNFRFEAMGKREIEGAETGIDAISNYFEMP